MEIILIFVLVLQAFAISMGVGSSTIAIVNFFVALADGKIDETERNLMGVVYVILRIAMVVILLTTLFIGIQQFVLHGASHFTPFVIAQWLTIIVLYTNAILMTLHIMPSAIGPALQASSWYTLGTLQAFIPLGLTDFSVIQFLIGYVCAIALAVSIVNGTMAYLKEKKSRTENPA